MDELLSSEKEVHRAGTEFLKADLATGLTLTESARNTADPAQKRHNQKSARKAYDTVVRMATKITLSDQEAKNLKQGLQRLRTDLIQLGETF